MSPLQLTYSSNTQASIPLFVDGQIVSRANVMIRFDFKQKTIVLRFADARDEFFDIPESNLFVHTYLKPNQVILTCSAEDLFRDFSPDSVFRDLFLGCAGKVEFDTKTLVLKLSSELLVKPLCKVVTNCWDWR